MTPELAQFLGDFPLFDGDGEPVDNPGWSIVDLRKGWQSDWEDRAQDREVKRLEREQLERVLAAFPEEERATALQWLNDEH